MRLLYHVAEPRRHNGMINCKGVSLFFVSWTAMMMMMTMMKIKMKTKMTVTMMKMKVKSKAMRLVVQS